MYNFQLWLISLNIDLRHYLGAGIVVPLSIEIIIHQIQEL